MLLIRSYVFVLTWSALCVRTCYVFNNAYVVGFCFILVGLPVI